MLLHEFLDTVLAQMLAVLNARPGDPFNVKITREL